MNVTGILGLLVAYVVGSFPSAYLAGRMLKGIDLRTVGSGNLGATNVFRELGPAAAVVVLLVDLLKGALPTLLLPGLLVTGIQSEAGTELWAVGLRSSDYWSRQARISALERGREGRCDCGRHVLGGLARAGFALYRCVYRGRGGDAIRLAGVHHRGGAAAGV